MRGKFNLTFEYSLTSWNVHFNNRSYTHKQFRELEKEVSYERSATTQLVDTKKKYKADYYAVMADGQVLIPAEIHAIAEVLELGLDFSGNHTLTNHNKYFDYIIIDKHLLMIDDERVREGLFEISKLIEFGVPINEIIFEFGLPLRERPHRNKITKSAQYPHLTGSNVGMGFSVADYTKFINMLKQV